MGKIKLLDKSLFNLISAGEVVEKPASVVKELVENSIDAGATKISIEILNGGIDLIKISDNGCGIEKDDLKNAFLPHATSKISTKEDLESIFTLGFRGEALASISAVSKVSMISKTQNQDEGYIIEVEGGDFKNVKPISSENGTIISVKNLFYNTPARYKFLKKPASEQAEITSIVEKLMLTHPNIIFSYSVNKQIMYSTNGSGLENVIYTIYGMDFLENLKPINYTQDKYHLTGFISKPQFSKNNRTYQTFMVNSRYVNSIYVSTAVQKAYEDYLMKGKFPVYILNLELPTESVDVNVHPSKLEVKFENQSKIFGLILDAVYKTINNFKEEYVVNVELNKKDNNEQQIDLSKLTNISNEGFSFSDTNKESININKEIEILANNDNLNNNSNNYNLNNEDLNLDNNLNVKNNTNIGQTNITKEEFNDYINYKNNFDETALYSPKTVVDKLANEIINENKENEFTKTNFAIETNSFIEKKPAFIGYLFNLFLLYEFDEELILVDQHACHERLNYDKLVDEFNSNGEIAKQNLLIPFIFDVNINEKVYLESILKTLNSIGFEIEEYGNNSFRVDAVPYVLQSINLKEFLDDVLSLNKVNITSLDLIKEKLMQKACKASIKAGDELSSENIEKLLSEILSGNKVLQCPHGRPIFVKVSRNEIEKWFKRIV